MRSFVFDLFDNNKMKLGTPTFAFEEVEVGSLVFACHKRGDSDTHEFSNPFFRKPTAEIENSCLSLSPFW